jgi:outer membrane protein assembly factor BamB
MTLDTSFNAKISGNVYAQPLFWQQTGVSEVIAATENNTVYALNSKTGAIIWQRQLPAAATSGFSCGDINPDGITGTPVIDPSTGTLYLNSETLESGALQDEIYALSLKDGSIVSGWPVNVQAALKGAGVTFTPAQQGSRSALLFFDGNVYASYGGRDGDCTPYHGTVVQIDPTTRKLAGNWETSAVGGGIWAQGGVSSDGKYLFATTGNTFNANNVWGGGEAIVRFKAGLAAPTSTANYFAPANWQALDNSDEDLGGTEAIPLAVSNGSGGVAQKVIALGKNGDAYLVNLLNLGGVGGPASIAQLSNTVILTAPAVYESASATMLAFTNYSGVQTNCSGTTIGGQQSD